jgi:hypothetical protein
MVIPNSKLVINPSPADGVWHKELYLRPGEWIPWVGVSVVAAMVAFAGVVIVLHLNEKVRRAGLWLRARLTQVVRSARTKWRGGGHHTISTSMRCNVCELLDLAFEFLRTLHRRGWGVCNTQRTRPSSAQDCDFEKPLWKGKTGTKIHVQ